MDFAKVDAAVRQQSGKGPARRSRTGGKVPAVLYGHKAPTVTLSVDPAMLARSLDKDKKRNTVFTLNVAGGSGKAEEVMAMIRDVQIHPLSRKVVHVDFIRVSMDEEVKVTVPLVLLGIPVGVTGGGNLHQSWHALPVAAKPAAIPNKIEIDVAALKIGDALHVSDLKLEKGIRVLLDAKQGVASVVAPRAEKVEEVIAPIEGAAAEGAAPAEGAAAGAAAAGGDKAGAAAAGAAGTKGTAGAKSAAPAAKKEGEKKGK